MSVIFIFAHREAEFLSVARIGTGLHWFGVLLGVFWQQVHLGHHLDCMIHDSYENKTVRGKGLFINDMTVMKDEKSNNLSKKGAQLRWTFVGSFSIVHE